MLTEDELREAHVLVFANKQDLPNAMTASELTDQLGLQSLRNRKVNNNFPDMSGIFWEGIPFNLMFNTILNHVL